MTLIDRFGYALTLADRPASDLWSQVVFGFLSHASATPARLAETLARAPDFALGHAAHGLFCLLLARRELVPVAANDLALAEAARRRTGATERELAVIAALRDWLGGAPGRAADRLDAALLAHPGDPFLVKLVHAIRFVLGDAAGMRSSVEAVLAVYGEDHPAAGYVAGCHAFALEETGAYAAAERAGRRAVALAPDDAWGLHAVAHVLDMTGRSQDGRAWLEDNAAAFGHCNNFRYHVWWHLALMYLDEGDVGRVLELYDQEIRAERTDDYRDVANAASLLVRLEIEGVNVGGRWIELSRLAETRVDDRCNVFANLHWMMALGAGDRRRAADGLLATFSLHAGEATDIGHVAATAGLPAARGLDCYFRGQYFSAFHHLRAARPHLRSIGGSHAQRDVFERIAIDAALKAGLAEEAETLLRDRLALRGALDRFAAERLEQAARMRRAAAVMADSRLRAVPA